MGGAWQDKDEAAIVEVGQKLLGELVSHDDWLPEQAAKVPTHGYAQNLLWCDPFERFCVVSFVWAPGAVTPVHDHQMWGMRGEGPIAELLSARFGAAVKRLGLNKIRYRLDTLRFRVPEEARTALVDAKRDARQMRLL